MLSPLFRVMHLCILFVMSLCGAMHALAQEPFFRFKHLTRQQGLSQSTITSIVQDNRGFLWFGSMDGLNRYDGYQFKVFTNDPDDSESLSDNRIMALLVARDNTLWIATLSGLNRYDWEKERFTTIPFPDSKEQIALSLMQDRNGALWTGAKGGVWRRDNTGNWTWFELQSNSDTYIGKVLEDRNGRIWIASHGLGLQTLDTQTGTFSSVLPISAENRVALTIYEDSLSRLWMGSATGGLFLFNPERDRLEPYDLPCRRVNVINEDDQGAIWIGSQNQGIFRISSLGTYRNFRHDVTLPNSLAEDQVLSIFQDNTSVIWIGLDNSGVNAFRSSPFHHYRREDKPVSLSNDNIWSIYEDRTGELWVGTSDGLNRINRDQGVIRHYRASSQSSSIASDKIRTILEDNDGILWFGSQGQGLQRYDRKSETFQNYSHDPSDPTSLSDNVITTTFQDRSGQLWVGAENGLNRMHDQTFKRYGVVPDAPDLGLPHTYVSTLHEDDSGRFWIGSMGGGLSLMDREQERFRHYQKPGDGNRSLNTITSIWGDSKTPYLWLGSYGGGLIRFDPENGAFKAWRSKDGLANDVVYGVLGDVSGSLWMSTNRGISRFDPDQERFHNYGVWDGVQSDEFNKGAFFKSDSGEMFFGGIQGFNAFRPERVTFDQTLAEVVLTDFRLFNKKVALRDRDPQSPLTKAIGASDRITLTHHHSMMTFEFAALHFADPDRNAYAYILENYDASWIEATPDNRRATYTNLDPGEYRFRVRASNKDGIWNEQGLTLGVSVKPPIWLTWWAKVFYIALVLFCLWLYSRSVQGKLERERRISEQERKMNAQTRLMAEKDRQLAEQAQAAAERLREFNRTLDQKVNERTTEVNQQKRELLKTHAQVEEQANKLEAQARELMEINVLKTRFFTNISHELRTPLTLILAPLQGVIDSPELQRDLPVEIMLRNARRLLDLINQLLDVSKLEAGKMDLKLESLDLVVFLKVRVHSFSSLAESRGIQLGFHADAEQVLVQFDPDKLEKVLYNLLSNAFKFTGQHGKVMVSLTTDEPDAIKIEVRDTGVGISRSQLPYVFDRFYQGREPQTERAASTGVGLAFSRELVRLHGGDITVQSEEDFGSVFSLTLPWRRGTQPLDSPPEPSLPTADPDTIQLPSQETEAAYVDPTNDHPRIVIIEDNQDIRTYMDMHLSPAYQVLKAGNGKTGLEMVQTHKPDLVICDVMMPDIDGFEVCRTLKNDPACVHIPIMLVTAKDSVQSKTTGWEMGADAYLVKPFTINELLALTANLIGSREKMRDAKPIRTVLNPADITATPADQAFLQQITDLLETNYSNHAFGVYEMADELAMSRRQLLRRLNSITGAGPADYLRDFRLQRAARLLEIKTGNISEIAYAVGFKNAAHFTARFREVFGVTPSEYGKEENES